MATASKTYQFFLLFVIALALAGCEKSKPVEDQTSRTLNIVVMDPLCDRLACDCVLGYAQRKYDLLGGFLEKQLNQKVWIRYGESLAEILRVNPGRVDLVIGKSSVVEYDVAKTGTSVHPIAALTDKAGTTKLTGLFVVRGDDKAKKIADLNGYKIMFGPEWETEKSTAAINALKLNGVSIPENRTRTTTCNASALAVIENDADAAVISSYALALLEGCDTIDKGRLKVIGKTAEVDFITVFAADELSPDDRDKIVRALLAVKSNGQLLKRMESLNGFIQVDQKAERNDHTTTWPDWRGPNRDSVSSDTPVELPQKANFLWRQPLTGLGLSGIAATKKYIIVADKDKKKELDIFRCLNADTGNEIWNLTYPAAGDMDYSNSPRANPVIHRGMVYTLGAFGDLHCVDLETGGIIWKKNIFKDFGAELLSWGSCSAPLITDDKIIINPGSPNASVVALDIHNGQVVWKTPGQIAAYASFIVGTFGNVRQVIGYDAISAGGWDIKTGKRLWKLIPPEDYDFNVPTPVNVDGKLLLTTENNGTRLYGFSDDGKIIPEPLAKNNALSPDSQTPVVLDGLAFGSYNGKLFCMDVKDDLKTLWSQQQDAFYEYQTLIAGNGHVLITTLEGRLMLIEVNRDHYSLKSRLKLFEDTEVWSHPALVGKRMYIRNDKEICCVLLGD